MTARNTPYSLINDKPEHLYGEEAINSATVVGRAVMQHLILSTDRV